MKTMALKRASRVLGLGAFIAAAQLMKPYDVPTWTALCIGWLIVLGTVSLSYQPDTDPAPK